MGNSQSREERREGDTLEWVWETKVQQTKKKGAQGGKWVGELSMFLFFNPLLLHISGQAAYFCCFEMVKSWMKLIALEGAYISGTRHKYN